jgi:hypothetical protein
MQTPLFFGTLVNADPSYFLELLNADPSIFWNIGFSLSRYFFFQSLVGYIVRIK